MSGSLKVIDNCTKNPACYSGCFRKNPGLRKDMINPSGRNEKKNLEIPATWLLNQISSLTLEILNFICNKNLFRKFALNNEVR